MRIFSDLVNFLKFNWLKIYFYRIKQSVDAQEAQGLAYLSLGAHLAAKVYSVYIRASGEIYFPPSPSFESTFAYPSVFRLRCHLKTLLVRAIAAYRLLVCCWLTLSGMLFTRTGFCLWSSTASPVGPCSCQANLLWFISCTQGLSFRCSVSYCYSSSFPACS